jgi:hypothetical protein
MSLITLKGYLVEKVKPEQDQIEKDNTFWYSLERLLFKWIHYNREYQVYSP